MLGGDGSNHVLVNVNFEDILKFELLEDSMYKNLIPYVEVDCVQTLEAP